MGLSPRTGSLESLREHNLLTDEELDAMDARIAEEVQDSMDFADRSPDPEPEELYRDVYAQVPERGRLFFDRMDRVGR